MSPKLPTLNQSLRNGGQHLTLLFMRHLFPVRWFWHSCKLSFAVYGVAVPRPLLVQMAIFFFETLHYACAGYEAKKVFENSVQGVVHKARDRLLLNGRTTVQSLYSGSHIKIFPWNGNVKISIARYNCYSDLYIEHTWKHWNKMLNIWNPCFSRNLFNCGITWRKLNLSLSFSCSPVLQNWWDLMWKDKLSLCSWDRKVPRHCGIVGKYLQLSHGNKIAWCRGLDLWVTDKS